VLVPLTPVAKRRATAVLIVVAVVVVACFATGNGVAGALIAALSPLLVYRVTGHSWRQARAWASGRSPVPSPAAAPPRARRRPPAAQAPDPATGPPVAQAPDPATGPPAAQAPDPATGPPAAQAPDRATGPPVAQAPDRAPSPSAARTRDRAATPARRPNPLATILLLVVAVPAGLGLLSALAGRVAGSEDIALPIGILMTLTWTAFAALMSGMVVRVERNRLLVAFAAGAATVTSVVVWVGVVFGS
jgi:hypothetical protein